MKKNITQKRVDEIMMIVRQSTEDSLYQGIIENGYCEKVYYKIINNPYFMDYIGIEV